MIRKFLPVILCASLLFLQAARCQERVDPQNGLEATHVELSTCPLCNGSKTLPGFDWSGNPLACHACDGKGMVARERLYFMPQESEVFVTFELPASGGSAPQTTGFAGSVGVPPPPALVLADDESVARAKAALALSAATTKEPAHVHESVDLSRYTWKQVDADRAELRLDGKLVGGMWYETGEFRTFDGKEWAKTKSEPPITRAVYKAPTRQVAQKCAGGCGPSCSCPATRSGATEAACTCAPSHRVNKPVSSMQEENQRQYRQLQQFCTSAANCRS